MFTCITRALRLWRRPHQESFAGIRAPSHQGAVPILWHWRNKTLKSLRQQVQMIAEMKESQEVIAERRRAFKYFALQLKMLTRLCQGRDVPELISYPEIEEGQREAVLRNVTEIAKLANYTAKEGRTLDQLQGRMPW
jgi:hypothetical protein